MLKRIVNATLSLAGLKAIRAGSLHYGPDAIPWGVDVWKDITRLAGDEPIRTVFDVGANVGGFSLNAVNRVPGLTIYSFEPIAETFGKLKSAVAGIPGVTPVQLACGPAQGRRTIPLYTSHEMNTLAVQPANEELCGQQTGTAEIEIDTVDHFCQQRQIDRIDLLKTDAEGYDLEVLHGAATMLAAGKVRFVYSEFYRLKQTGSTSGTLIDLADYVAQFGYRFVTTYTDYVVPQKDYFGVHNALFALSSARPGVQ